MLAVQRLLTLVTAAVFGVIACVLGIDCHSAPHTMGSFCPPAAVIPVGVGCAIVMCVLFFLVTIFAED
jgi:hypothetical protein